MCLCRPSEAVGNLRPNPLALGAAGQLPTPQDPSGAPLRGAKPRPAQDRGQGALAAACLATLMGGAAATHALRRETAVVPTVLAVLAIVVATYR